MQPSHVTVDIHHDWVLLDVKGCAAQVPLGKGAMDRLNPSEEFHEVQIATALKRGTRTQHANHCNHPPWYLEVLRASVEDATMPHASPMLSLLRLRAHCNVQLCVFRLNRYLGGFGWKLVATSRSSSESLSSVGHEQGSESESTRPEREESDSLMKSGNSGNAIEGSACLECRDPLLQQNARILHALGRSQWR